MTNKDILKIAMQQSAIDANCNPEDFCRKENVIVESKENPKARKYLELPLPCDLIYYGTNIVASIDIQYRDIVEEYINKYSAYRCFETPNMHVLNDAFSRYGYKVCFMAEYFLPDLDILKDIDLLPNSDNKRNNSEFRVLEQKDFEALYVPEWSHALCKDRKHLDVLGVGAYRNDKLIGLAACSADCDTMWQIGVDVLPEERRKGLASALTSNLAKEILKRDKVPFYCCAWSNTGSARNAIKSGFRPAWAELTVKKTEFVEKMNK